MMYRRIFTYLRVKYLCCLFLLLMTTKVTMGQSNVTVSGKATDEQGGPLPGVSVKLKGTANGVMTDLDGKYTIKVPDGTGILVFSFIGFKKQEIKIGDRKTVNVVLQEDKNDLNEVVVVAYGQQKKESMVSSITAINPK